jgi:hypothetical protein
MNVHCPVRPEDEADPNRWVLYKGKKVYFCCEKCQRRFLADPEAYLDRLPQFQADPDPSELRTIQNAADEESRVPPSGWIEAIGRFHPVIVHFPIVMVLLAALAETAFWRTRRLSWALATRHLVRWAVPAALVAVILGLADASGQDFPGQLGDVVEAHEFLGFATLILLVLGTLLERRSLEAAGNPGMPEIPLGTRLDDVGGEVHYVPWARRAFRLILALAVLTVGVGGHLGGTIVYGLGYFPFP